MEKKEQEVAEEYLSSLADLNLNSKPLINMLTILAEENIEYATIIVKAVEQHISKVNPDVKLPVLYLIDSIVKNVGREYIPLFSHCIVNIFCGVFEKVNEKIREKMYTLRQTWNDVFTPQKLYTLDVKVNCMDPNWPITAKVIPKSPAIHVNPNFLKKSEPINEMQAKLRDKQRQLLELQKRKLELELAATKQRLEEQEKQLNMQTESVKPVHGVAILPASNPASRSTLQPLKTGQQKTTASANVATNISTSGNNQTTKTRVAPVNPTILTSMRQRDPRLARQQQTTQSASSSIDTQSIAPLAATKPLMADNRNSVASSSILANETKSLEDTYEKQVQKLANIKSSYVSGKDKHRSSSNANGNKRSQTKGASQKSLITSDSKSPSRSSAARSKTSRISSSRNSNNSKILDKDIRSKLHLNEKRKSSKGDLPRRAHDINTKLNEKSPKKQLEFIKTNEAPNHSSTHAKFKDLKEGMKSRNYIRRNREKSKSPVTMHDDADLRFSTSDKRIKMDDQKEQNKKHDSNEESSIQPTVSPMNTDDKKPQSLEKNLEAVSCMDVDLRQFQSNISASPNLTAPGDDAQTTNMNNNISDLPSKKRVSTDNSEEPASKKTKSEKLDTLFGTEDVDLRKLNAVPNAGLVNSVMPMTPPPPPIISKENESWAMVKKSNLDDVRKKLAKATKNINRKKSETRFSETQKAGFSETNDDSEDGTDAKIRTIISQAQELLDTENMNVDQYNVLVKTVIQINETNKLKEAQRRESLLVRANNLEDLTPISDDEVKFSSEEEPETENLDNTKKAKHKRMLKLAKGEKSESDIEKTCPLPRPSSSVGNNGNGYLDVRSKNDKRGRQRESKWASSWDNSSMSGQKNWLHANNHRMMFPPKIPSHTQQQTMGNMPIRMHVPNPWQNPPPMIFPPPIPISHINPAGPETKLPPVVLAQRLSNSVDNPNSDVLRTVTIDKMQKEIRFYDEIPIAFMEWDQPKQIGFQNGQRRITIDDRDTITLNFNDDYKSITIDGKIHKIRFGCPTRELFIDNNWYECYFGDPPVGIFLDGRVRIFKIEGPPPQVLIGNLRQDLVVGKINLIVDARIIIPVFLDAKVQTFELDGAKHTLQFADNLQTVLIDNEPICVEYGGLPKSLLLNDVKHFIRLGTLPSGIIPGKVFIKDMIRTENFENIDRQIPTSLNEASVHQVVSTQVSENSSKPVDAFGQRLNNTSAEEDFKKNDSENESIPAQINNINIDELFQKLLASGILNQNSKTNTTSEDSTLKAAKEKDIIKPIDLTKPETIKKRQNGIVQKLFFGMQCSSCGVRFPPEQTMKYSQHLDWHFRQNRRERDSARKAHSRKWYYDVSDWIQYEEIEDLDEREKNWFETQQNELENFDENSNQRVNSPPPSCPAGPDGAVKACDMCHDKFEQFYNEESEEWHLRSAIRVEEKIYHPVCYEDYKASLNFDESMSTENATDDNAVDNVIVKSEKQDKNGDAEKDCDDDDDVIVVPNEEPSITEIPDDDEDEPKLIENLETRSENPEGNVDLNENEETDATTQLKSNDSMESDVEIQEPNIPFTDLDTYEEAHPQSISTLDDSSQSSQLNQIKIKEEPKYDGYDDDAFEDVGTFVCVDDLSQNNEEYVPQAVVSVPHETIKACIDGNVELQEAPASSIGVNKIKINITKNVTSNQKTNVTCNENSQNAQFSGSINESVNDKSVNFIENVSDNKAIDPVSCNNDKNSDSVSVISNNFCSSEIVFKPEMQGIEFENIPRCTSGFETSGLCSIM